MSIKFRLAYLNEYPKISRFINKEWKKNHAYTRSKALFKWTFKDNPKWKKSNYSISLAIEKDKIIGMLGVIPFKLNIYGKLTKACWLVNWFTIREKRNGPTGLKLLNLFTKKDGYNKISFGINNTIKKLYSALDWQHMPKILRIEWIDHTKINEVKKFLKKSNPSATLKEINDYISRHNNVLKHAANTPKQTLASIKPDLWNKYGWLPWSKKIIGCSRDFSYLNWRYLEHPNYKYESRILFEGKKIGLIIWRIEITKINLPNGKYKNYHNFARIVEFLPVSKSNAESLISIFITDATKAGAIAADFYNYNISLISMLKKLGFRLAKNESHISLPNFTQPILKNNAIRSCIKISSKNKKTLKNYDWYWTISDSDQDRLN